MPAQDDALKIEIKGLKELQRKAEQMTRDLHGPPMLEAMRRATLVVQRAAKINAPVSDGRLRASITPEVRAQAREVVGVVGTNVKYAPYVEFGTRPHWPPFGPDSSLARWSHLHGIENPYLVARGIAAHGTKAVKFLERAVTDNEEQIYRILGDAVAEIVDKDTD